MKRILFINDFNDGGGAEIIYNQTIDLLQHDFVCQRFVGSESITQSNNALSYIFSFNNKRRLTKLLASFQPDIIHIHNYYHLLSPSILLAILHHKKQHKIKVIITAHDFHLCFPNSGFFFLEGKKLFNIKRKITLTQILLLNIDHRGHLHGFIKKAQWILSYRILHLQKAIDVIISPSNFLKNYLDLTFDKTVPVKLLRNPYRFHHSVNRTNIDQTEKSVVLRMVFVGRVSYEKGLAEFIMALKTYKKPYIFDIVGDGNENYVNELKNLSQNMSVFFLGRKDRYEILETLKNYDAIVLCSLWYENFPTVLLEAGASGLRILTCNYGGMYELGSIIGNSYFFDIFDPDSVIKAIETCEVDMDNHETIVNVDFYESISEENYKQSLISIYN